MVVRYLFAFSFLLSILATGYGQSDSTNKKQPSEFDINYEMASTTPPAYQAGMAKLQSEIINNIDLTKAADLPNGTSVTISCRVENDGKLTDIKIIEPVGYGLDKQIKEQLKNKLFNPIKQDGNPTSCAIILSIPLK